MCTFPLLFQNTCTLLVLSCSLSGDQMQVVNPMETIQEGETLHVPYSSHAAHHGSFYASPLSSPGRTRRYHSQLHNNLRAHLSMSVSKSTLDGLQASDVHKEPKLLWQTLKGASASNAQTPMSSYVEGWLQEHTPRFEVTTVNSSVANLSATPSTRNPVHTDNYPTVFTMDEDAATEPACQLAQSHTECTVTVDQVSGVENNPLVGTEKVTAVETPAETTAAEAPVVIVTAGSYSNASTDSFPDYEPPEANQCTLTSVNSMTPLLKDSNPTDEVEIVVM